MGFEVRVALMGLLMGLGALGCVDEPDYTGRQCTPLDPCPAGFVCAPAGSCVAEGSLTDAGPAPDSGPTLDSGARDAGTSDASPFDGGAPDAAPRDSGTPDVGPRDAGFPDAGDPRLARCANPIEYPTQGWQVRYFELPGLPDPTFGGCLAVDDRADDQLDVTYAIDEAPAGGFEDFGAIFTARRTFSEGVHTFLLDHDDGVRVYIDGNLAYEDWNHDRALDVVFLTPFLTAGAHDLHIELFDDDGEALIRLGYERGCTRLVTPARGWVVSYHGLGAANAIVEALCYGVETLTSTDLDINHGLSAPAPVLARGVTDGFALIARSQPDFRGLTMFSTWHDDGLRLFVDGSQILNDWSDGGYRAVQASVHALGGRELRVEKYDATDISRLEVSFDPVCDLVPPGLNTNEWFARYYALIYRMSPETWLLDRDNCLGAEVLPTRFLDFDGTPAVVAAAGYTELWGAEFSGPRAFTSQPTSLALVHDDGLRIFADGSLIYEDWTAPLVRTAQTTIAAGAYDMRVEYFENFGGEQLHITW